MRIDLFKRFRMIVMLAMMLLLNSITSASSPAQIRAMVDTARGRELMRPDVLGEGSFGMADEQAERAADGTITIVTTGARFVIDPAAATVRCAQRLGQARDCATITFDAGAFDDAQIASHTAGAAILQLPAGRLRINCDSLLMFAPDGSNAAKVQVQTHFKCQWNVCAGANWLKLDNYGGLGVYVIGRAQAPTEPGADRLDLQIAPGEHGELLWVSIAPPRPFNWDESIRDQYFSYWTHRDGDAHPGQAGIAEWKEKTRLSVLILQSEVMGWKDWQKAFEPRSGDEAMRRTLRGAHEQDVRVIVYTSPLYFTRGTPVEVFATNDFVPGKPRYGPGWTWGDNVDLFMAEISKLLRRFEIDGLYFDGLYSSSVVQSYRVVREARRMLGSDRLLALHTTWGPPFNSMTVFCPAIDTHANLIYRGENMKVLATHTSYLRYLVSGYNISNAVGAPVHDGVPAEQLNDHFINTLLDFNARVLYHGGLSEAIGSAYWPALADPEALKQRVERVMAERQATHAAPRE